jgi:hypothetical protein
MLPTWRSQEQDPDAVEGLRRSRRVTSRTRPDHVGLQRHVAGAAQRRDQKRRDAARRRPFPAGFPPFLPPAPSLFAATRPSTVQAVYRAPPIKIVSRETPRSVAGGQNTRLLTARCKPCESEIHYGGLHAKGMRPSEYMPPLRLLCARGRGPRTPLNWIGLRFLLFREHVFLQPWF